MMRTAQVWQACLLTACSRHGSYSTVMQPILTNATAHPALMLMLILMLMLMQMLLLPVSTCAGHLPGQ